MEIKDAKYIMESLNSFTESLTDKELCIMVDWFIFGFSLGKEKDSNSEHLIFNILGEEVFESYMKHIQTGSFTEHSGIMNMTRVHLLQISFDRFKKQLL